MARGEEPGEGERHFPTVGEKYRVAQSDYWPLPTKEARAALFTHVLAGAGEEDLPEFSKALDRYVAALLVGLSKKLLDIPHDATALTGPYWFGQGWEDAAKQVEEYGWYIDPD